MTRNSFRLIGLLILIVFVGIGCTSTNNNNKKNVTDFKTNKIQSYPIPYSAPGKHYDIYKNVREVNNFNETIDDLVDYAKKIAKASGYAIIGNNLDKYLYEGREYELQTSVYENDEYYMITFLPHISDSGKSPSGGWWGHSVYDVGNLEMSFRKKTMEVVTILQGP